MSVPAVTPWCSRGPRGCRCSAPPLPVRSGRLLDAMPDRYRALHQQCGLMPTRSRWIKTPDNTSGCRRIVLGVDVDHDARTLSETDPPDNDVESSVEWERDPGTRGDRLHRRTCGSRARRRVWLRLSLRKSLRSNLQRCRRLIGAGRDRAPRRRSPFPGDVAAAALPGE